MKCDHPKYSILYDGKRFVLVCDECGMKERSFETYDQALEFTGQDKLFHLPLDKNEVKE